jgi:Mn2+/Fe2+ NRAMP family transporter
MAVTFGVEYIIAEPNQADVMLGLVCHSMTQASTLGVTTQFISLAWQVVPTLSSSTIQQAVGMVGAVIMPHNIYLHSALVQVRHRPHCLDLNARRLIDLYPVARREEGQRRAAEGGQQVLRH